MKKPPVGARAGMVLLWLCYAFTRLHNLTVLPFFVDEGYHTEAAERTLEGELIGPGMGYLLHVWYNAWLGPHPPAADWTTRAGTVLVGMLGMAALYALARAFVSPSAGLAAAALWVITPFLLFFERMALSDPLLTPLSVVAVWVAWQAVHTGRARWGAALSALVGVLILVKASGIVWIALLVVVVLLMRSTWQNRVRLGAIMAGTFLAGFWVPFLVVLRARGFGYGIYVGELPSHVGGLSDNLLDRLGQNISRAWEIDLAYLGLPIIMLAVIAGLYWLWRSPRPALLSLMALGISASGPVVFGLNLNSRYMLGHVPWVLLPLAVGAGLLIERDRRAIPVVIAALGAWALVFYLPFQQDVWADPAALSLVRDDRDAYIARESSGYALREAGERLAVSGKPLPVLGLVANCQALRLAAYPLEVICPVIRWDGTSRDELIALAEQWAARGAVYVASEVLPYIDLDRLPVPHTLLFTTDRPHDGLPVSVYRLERGAVRPALP